MGLGSNVGDRLDWLRHAIAAISELGELHARSAIYETAPVGGPPQGDFLNAAVLVGYTRSARALLDDLLAIEQRLGRVRTDRWGPRTIDLDVLWIDGVTVAEPGLVVPHARLAERAFAIAPLLDVAPDAPYVLAPDASVRRTDLAW